MVKENKVRKPTLLRVLSKSCQRSLKSVDYDVNPSNSERIPVPRRGIVMGGVTIIIML